MRCGTVGRLHEAIVAATVGTIVASTVASTIAATIDRQLSLQPVAAIVGATVPYRL